MTYQISTKFKMPKNPRPIVIIGAGSIIKDAHLPAYQKANWLIYGIYDIDKEKAESLASIFQIKTVFSSLKELVEKSPPQIIFDIAVPASEIYETLKNLPSGAAVMIQKPFGENIIEAKKLLDLCTENKFTASVNFQMKLIPSIIAAKNLIDQGAIGDLHDMEIRMNIYHPWELWNFLFGLPRMEMLYHSIHYMDMIKYFLGMPQSVHAKTFQHPKQMELASTRSVIIFDYNKPVRAFINTNHGHDFGLKNQDSFVKFEGTKGAIKATLGKNINFPKGEEDHFEYISQQDGQANEWITTKVPGAWYPDAFMATMADLQCAVDESSSEHITSAAEAFKTMLIVEAAYQSDTSGGTPVIK